MKLVLVFICIVFLLYRCDANLWEDGVYAVYHIDGHAMLGIKIDEEGTFHNRVDAEIIAVGVNEKFVVVKQRAEKGDPISYYYIDKKLDDMYLNPDEITQGPFSKQVYNELSQNLGFPEFSQEF